MATLQVGAGETYTTIQAAITAAVAGDTIVIAAGTYNETITIDKDGLTLVGDGVVEINGTFSEDNPGYATSDQSLAEWLKTTPGYTGGTPGVTIAASGVSLSNITVKDSSVGVELADGANGATLEDVVLESNVIGIRKGTAAAITDLNIEGGSISDGFIGINFEILSGSGGTADGVVIDGTHFADLLLKGIYVETLSNAHLTNITMEDVGNYGNPAWAGTPGASGNGINVNLKFGDYQNIEIDNFSLNNVGASNLDGANPTGHQNGGAIVIEARDDGGTYGPDPATLTNVTVHDGTITGETSTGIHVGEPGRDNAGPAVTVTNVTINGAEHSAVHGDIANESESTMTVVGTSGNDSLIASTNSDGAFDINGAGGDDTIAGGSADDTLAGGAGNDSFIINAGDTIIEAAGEGIDSVFTTDSYTLPDNVENITLLDVGSDTQDFENFAEGAITDGENGWRAANDARDQAVVDVDGNLVFRMSSDPGGGDFAGPYSPDLGFNAGEPQTTADGNVHILKFRVKPVSDTPDDSRMEVDFGRADGLDRNNFMAIESTGDGIRIAVNHPVPGAVEDWANDDFAAFTGNITLIEGVDPTVWHDIELRLVYKDGADNDVIKVYLDGAFIGQTTTFENYRDTLGGDHADNAEQNQTNSIFFRPNAGGAPQDGAGGENQGFYFDDITNTITNNVNATGNGIDNVITGNSGDNVLAGLGGNDTLIGGGGTDSLNGGDGTDTAVYATSLAAGDIVFSGASWWIEAGAEGMDVLTGIERVTHGGVGQILLVGGGGYANRTAAEAAMGANDVLLFASTPGAVTDTDAAVNSVVEQAANGTVVGIDANATTDGVGGGVSYSLSNDAGGRFAIDATTGVVTVANGALLDYETATGHQITVRATNALGAFSEQTFDVQLQDVAQVVDPGTKGNDTIVGTTEPDVIDGDKGKDTLYGAGGDDSLSGGNSKDKVYGGDGQDGIDGGKGKDQLYGGNGDDTLSGGKGADRIQGGGGIDTASYASSSSKVRIDLNATKQKGGDANGDKLFSIENVTGSEHNDRITGNKGANVLDGAGGNDRLDGQGGTDTLIGGDGRDLFLFKKGYGNDTIADFASGDIIAISYKGVDNFKDLKALMTDTDGDVVIDFGHGDVLTIADTTTDSLGKADFHL